MGVQWTPATLLVLQPRVSRLLEHSLRLAWTILTVMIISGSAKPHLVTSTVHVTELKPGGGCPKVTPDKDKIMFIDLFTLTFIHLIVKSSAPMYPRLRQTTLASA